MISAISALTVYPTLLTQFGTAAVVIPTHVIFAFTSISLSYCFCSEQGILLASISRLWNADYFHFRCNKGLNIILTICIIIIKWLLTRWRCNIYRDLEKRVLQCIIWFLLIRRLKRSLEARHISLNHMSTKILKGWSNGQHLRSLPSRLGPYDVN